MNNTSLLPCRLKLSRTLVSGMNPDGTGLWGRSHAELLTAAPDDTLRLDGLAINASVGADALWHSLPARPPFLLCWQQTAHDTCYVTLFSESEQTLRRISDLVPLELSNLSAFHRHIIFKTTPYAVQSWLLPSKDSHNV